MSELENRCFREALDFVSDCIIFLNNKTEIFYLNEQAKHFLGDQTGMIFEEIVSQTRAKDLAIDDFLPSTKRVDIKNRSFLLYERRVSLDTQVGILIILRPTINHMLGQAIENPVDFKVKAKIRDEQHKAKFNFQDIITEDDLMKRIIHLAKKVAMSEVNVLIQGESGTGKELFAQAIHNYSQRKDGPFIAINCSAIPKDLFEAELFGYDEGAFTGAKRSGKMGMFELAHNGTIFLDEIGDMPRETQMKLLRVIQEREVMRVGSTKTIKVDARIISATNVQLYEATQTGDFRLDLYYRIGVFKLRLPPLRERKQDIKLVANSILNKSKNNKLTDIRGFTDLALAKLEEYHWPGNIRELENIVEQAMILAEDNLVTAEDIVHDEYVFDNRVVEINTMEDLEKETIIQALRAAGGNKHKAAEKLGLSRATIYNKIKKFAIDK
jgi:transcriptional regulator with PAS, ATPase and Fis domain